VLLWFLLAQMSDASFLSQMTESLKNWKRESVSLRADGVLCNTAVDRYLAAAADPLCQPFFAPNQSSIRCPSSQSNIGRLPAHSCCDADDQCESNTCHNRACADTCTSADTCPGLIYPAQKVHCDCTLPHNIWDGTVDWRSACATDNECAGLSFCLEACPNYVGTVDENTLSTSLCENGAAKEAVRVQQMCDLKDNKTEACIDVALSALGTLFSASCFDQFNVRVYPNNTRPANDCWTKFTREAYLQTKRLVCLSVCPRTHTRPYNRRITTEAVTLPGINYPRASIPLAKH